MKPPIDCVEKLKLLAEAYHQGTLRKDGITPYIEHPKAVVALLESWGITDPITLAIAWGHDLLEETPVERRDVLLQEILSAGGEEVLQGIKWLTFDPTPEAREDKALKANEKEVYIETIARKAPMKSLVVKVADRLCNTRDFLKLGNPLKARRYLSKGKPLLTDSFDFALFSKVLDEWRIVEAEVTDAIRSQNNRDTEVVFIVDRSGSMGSLVKATLDGFNEMLEKQRLENSMVRISTVLFNTEEKEIHSHADILTVKPLTEADYQPYGGTALLDAIGSSISRMELHLKCLSNYDVLTPQVLFVILTDGEENSSRTYRISEIRKKIEEKREKEGWEFLFLGANIDAIQTATSYGISCNCAMDYVPDEEGTRKVFSLAEEAIPAFASASKRRGTFRKSFEKEILELRQDLDADYQARSPKKNP